MPIAIGISYGAALALVQYAITRALVSRAPGGKRGVVLFAWLKLPLSMLALALLGLYSVQALAFAACGYTLASAIVAIYQYKRRGE